MSFSSLKITCVHKTGKKTPKTEPKEPRPAQPRVSRRKVGLSPAPLTSVLWEQAGGSVESSPSRAGFVGTSWVCHSISNGSELYPGAVESDRSCAAVYGPDSLQEKWLGFLFFGFFFFFFPFQLGFLFFLHKFAQPSSFPRAWSKAQSTARLAPTLPSFSQEMGKSWETAGQARPAPPARWDRAAGATPAQSKPCPGGSWKALMTVHVVSVPITAASPAAPALPHLPGTGAGTA